MGDIKYSDTKSKLGQIGGIVGGFRRRERQNFYISFLKLIEIEEYHDLNLTSNLAKKILIEFTGDKAISNDMLVGKFSKSGNKVRQNNLDGIASYISEKYRERFDDMWADAQVQIDIDTKIFKENLLAALLAERS